MTQNYEWFNPTYSRFLTFCLGNRIFRLGDTVLLFLSPTRNPTLWKNVSLPPRSQLVRGRWILQSRDGRQSSKRCKMKSWSCKPSAKLRNRISNFRNPSSLQTFNQCHHFLLQFMSVVRKIFHCSDKNRCSNRPKFKSKLGPHQRMNIITENHHLTRRNRFSRGGWEGGPTLPMIWRMNSQNVSWGLNPEGIYYLKEQLVPFKAAVNACNPESSQLGFSSEVQIVVASEWQADEWEDEWVETYMIGFCWKMHKNMQFVSVKLSQAGSSTVHLVDNTKTHAC